MLFHLKTLMPQKVVFFFFLRSRRGKFIKPPGYLDDYVLSTNDSDENLTYREAMESSLESECIESTREMYNALIENKTWMLSPLPRVEKQLEAGGFSKLGDTATELFRNSRLVL